MESCKPVETPVDLSSKLIKAIYGSEMFKGHWQQIFLFLISNKHSHGILNFVFLVVDRVQLLRNIVKLSTGICHLEKIRVC